MKRFSILVAAFAAILLFARPALAINLHNGAIVVQNKTNSELRVEFEHGVLKGLAITKVFSIYPHKTIIANSCCFAAGSPYVMHSTRSVPMGGQGGQVELPSFVVTPHLCNKNGIPYGYAVIVVDPNYTIHEVDHNSCY